MCLRFEDHCRTYHSFAIRKCDESTKVHGKWTDNVLVFYGYDVNCKRVPVDLILSGEKKAKGLGTLLEEYRVVRHEG